MFARILIRNTVAALRLSVTAAPHTKQIPHNANMNAVFATQSTTPLRFYSEQNKMTVDYDYVKNATSNNNILIVDVREPDEIKEHGKIPNSINIPLGNITTVLSTMSDKEFQQTYEKPRPSEDTQIIFYCMIGKRSGMAQQNAINAGFKNTKNYLGSWTDWASKSQS